MERIAEPGEKRRRRRIAKEHGPDPIDLHVGQQLRLARGFAGMTQVELGRKLKMSFQVVQKYEQGEIRVSASRLFQLAALLNKPVSYFFEGLEQGRPPVEAGREIGRREIDLVRAYRTIQDPELQLRVFQLVKDIAAPALSDGAGAPEAGETPGPR